MDIIKITGAAVVLMSSFMLGMYFVVVNKTRIKNLADIDETWRTISAEIRFQSGSLPEIFKRFASHEYPFGIKALYKDVYENMVVDSEKAAFDIIWRESVRNNASKSCFLREDEEFLMQFGNMPVHLDIQTQTDFVNHMISMLDDRIKKAQDKTDSQCRIYRCMGIAAGVFLVLVLI